MIGVYMSNLFSRLSLRGNIVTAAIAAFLLVACGGDGDKASDPDPSAEADFVVDTFGDLSVCTGNREGATAYVKDEEKDYICTDGDWAIDTNADTRKKSSSSKDKANSSNSKDKVKSGSSSGNQKAAWDYLNPNIDYGEMVDDRDGQIYKTVKIGDQVWMAENLNYETENSYCYENYAHKCNNYGRLYTWAAAVGKSEEECGYGNVCRLFGMVRGVCPEGWRLPDTTEWNILFTAVGGKSIAGKKLKSQTGWFQNGNGTDAYGFSAFPASGRIDNGHFDTEGFGAFFWSATEFDSSNAYSMNLSYIDEGAYLYEFKEDFAFSVRCLKDDLISSSSSAKLSSSSCGDCKDDAKSSSSFAGPTIAWDYLNPDIDYGEMVDDRDGQIYKTVKIGDQVWMAENLNYTMDSSFCFFAEHCSKYGDYYTWEAAVAACPKGWHLPDTAEWNTLFTEVGGTATAGMMLKTQTDWFITTDTKWLNDSVSTNAYGFSALPAGSRGDDGNILYGNDAYFWSATDNGRNAYYCYMLMRERDHKRAALGLREKYYGLSVRCLQD